MLSLATLASLAALAMAAQDAPVLKEGDQRKLIGPVGEWIQGKAAANYDRTLEARDDLNKALESVQKNVKGRSVLSLVADWAVILEEAREYPRTGFKTARAEAAKAEGGDPYASWIPKTYNPRKSALPLLVILPDPSSDPVSAIQALPPEVLEAALILALDYRGIPAEEVFQERGRYRLLRPLGEIFRSFRVDRDRVCVVGVGPMAAAAAGHAARLPHWFAAVSLVGGKPEGLPESNLKLVALGEAADLPAAARWCLEQKPRQPFPMEFEITLLEAKAGRAFWVHATRFDYAGTLPEGKAATLKVAVDRAKNTIRIDAQHVYEVDLFLNDAIVDLDQPVHIVRNGVSYDFQATRSVGTLLDNFALNLDARSVYPVVVRAVDLPAQG